MVLKHLTVIKSAGVDIYLADHSAFCGIIHSAGLLCADPHKRKRNYRVVSMLVDNSNADRIDRSRVYLFQIRVHFNELGYNVVVKGEKKLFESVPVVFFPVREIKTVFIFEFIKTYAIGPCGHFSSKQPFAFQKRNNAVDIRL